MIKLVIHQERCKSCGLCIAHCPKENLKAAEQMNLAGYHPITQCDEAACTGCGICALMCPDVAIEIYRVEEAVSQSE